MPGVKKRRSGDSWGGKEKREPGRRFPAIPLEKTRGDGDPGPGDSGKQGHGLSAPDDHGIFETHFFQGAGETVSSFGIDPQEADEDQGESNQGRIPEGAFYGFSQQNTHDSRRKGGQDNIDDQPFLNILNSAAPENSKKPCYETQPVPPEIPENSQESSGMERDVKRKTVQEGVIPLKKPRQKDQMGGAADGQKFSQALQDTQKKGLKGRGR